MNDNGETILLCLVNNDPCSTILMTPSGQPLYSITTPNARPPQPSTQRRPSLSDMHRTSSKPDAVADATAHAAPPQLKRTNSSPSTGVDGFLHASSSSSVNDPNLPAISKECHIRRGSVTYIKRVDDCVLTTGLVETTIATIKGGKDETVCVELPGQKDFALIIPHVPYHTKSLLEGAVAAGAIADGGSDAEDSQDDSDEEESGIESWEFEGPDLQQYRWFMLGNSPIMAHINHSMSYPIARYRRAKLGIVSRPRRGFLEIFPHGNVSIDLIVTTFVGFMRTCVIPAQKCLPGAELNPPRIDSRRATVPLPGQRPSAVDPTSKQGKLEGNSVVASSIPSRFQSAAALARKHSRGPPATAISFPPFAVKQRPLPTSGFADHI